MRLRIILLLGAVVLASLVFFLLKNDTRSLVEQAENRQASLEESPGTSPARSQSVSQETVFENLSNFDSNDQDFNCSFRNLEPQSETTLENEEKRADQFWKMIDRITGQLSASADAEHWLLAGILGSTDAKHRYDLEQIQKAVDLDPDNTQFNWHLLQACASSGESSACKVADIEHRAVSVDGENAALWANIAVRRAKRDDEAGAIEAFRRAIAAPVFNSYLIDDVMMFERGLSATTDLTYGERVIFAIGTVVTLPSIAADVHRACEPHLETSEEWRSMCLQIAQRIEQAGQTILDVQIGLATQKLVYKLSGMDDHWSETNMRAERNREEMKLGWSSDVELVLTVDDRVSAAYIDEWAAHGELAAIRFSREVTERLKTLPGYDPCTQLEKLKYFRESQ